MLKIKDIMTTELITVSPETEILQVAEVLLGNHINGVPVVDEAGKMVGINSYYSWYSSGVKRLL